MTFNACKVKDTCEMRRLSKKFWHALKAFFLCIMTALSSVSNITVVVAEEDQKTDQGGVRVSLSVVDDKTTAEPGTTIVVHVDASFDIPDGHEEDTLAVSVEFDVEGSIASVDNEAFAMVSLRHGQTIEIDGLPGNVGYTITELEANQNGNTTTDSGITKGEILPSDTITVSFENRNHYIPELDDDPKPTPTPTLYTGYQLVLTEDK